MQSNIAIGRLTKTPELRVTKDGKSIVLFTLAINNTKDSTTFLDMVAFNKTAELIHKYCEKGRQLCVQYSIFNDSYEKDNKKVYRYKFIVDQITFLGSKNTSIDNTSNPFEEFGNEIALTQEDLPF